MGFPMLIAAIRASGCRQWQIAPLAYMSESRLSRICRRGGASPEEREVLSRLLGVSEDELFGPGPSVSLNPDRVTGERQGLNRRDEGDLDAM